MYKDLLLQLNHQPLRKQLISHSFLKKMRSHELSNEQVTTILGQWFHPLHHFPVFLSQLISILPSLSVQTFISKILWQELGEGDPERAHQDIYIKSMVGLGFGQDTFVNRPPLPATRDLVNGYKKSIQDGHLAGLGFVFGTEVADLAMVSAIGHSVTNLKKVKYIEWVDIHCQQEPNHVESVGSALSALGEKIFTSSFEEEQVIKNAAAIWQLWIGFFDSLEKETSPEENSEWIQQQKLAI